MTFLRVRRRNHPAPVRDEGTRAAQCVGKDAYDTVDLARKVMQRSRGKAPLSPYRCDFCRKWHLGVHLQKNLRNDRR